MHFSQVNGIRGGDFSEMRAYMIGKLMWDPYQNADSLMRTFMNGYYGAAAPTCINTRRSCKAHCWPADNRYGYMILRYPIKMAC